MTITSDADEIIALANRIKGLAAPPIVIPDTPSTGRTTISITDFSGGVATGSSSNFTALNKALAAAGAGGVVLLPHSAASYVFDGLVTLNGVTLTGQKRWGTKILHAYNGNMFSMGDGAGLKDLWLDGRGANFTGACMDFSGASGRQGVIGVQALDWDGPVMQFGADAGSQSYFADLHMARRNAGSGTNRHAVVISPTQQLAAVPRKFNGIETSGQCAFDFGGCNGVFITNSFVADLKYTPDTRGVSIATTRIANQAELTIRGHNNSIVGCGVNPRIIIAPGADNNHIGPNSLNNAPIIDQSGNGRNQLYYWDQVYTPIITTGGAAPSIGNGSITGSFSRQGSTVFVSIEFRLGSTTSLGTGDIRFSLPTAAPCTNGLNQTCGTFTGFQGAPYNATALLPAGVQYVTFLRDSSGSITSASPVAWASGATMRVGLSYKV